MPPKRTPTDEHLPRPPPPPPSSSLLSLPPTSGTLTYTQIVARLQTELDALQPGLTLRELIRRADDEVVEVEDSEAEQAAEDDEEEEEEEQEEAFHSGPKFLNEMLLQLGQPAAAGRYQGGRPRKSGATKIGDAARRELTRSQVKANLAARALGLDDCRIAQANFNRRPTIQSLELYKEDGTKTKPRLMTYHVTWVAANGAVPGGRAGIPLEYSHRCGERCCIEAKHGLFQTHPENLARCRSAAEALHCQCLPPCIFP